MKNTVLILLLFAGWACEKSIPPTHISPLSLTQSGNDVLPDTLQMQTWMQQVTASEHRRVGSAGWYAGMTAIEQALSGLGFSDLKKDYFDIQYWQCTDWSLQVQSNGQNLTIPCYYEQNAGFTPAEGISAPLVYVGRQVDANENVFGKIAVIDLEFSRQNNLPNPVIRPNHLSFKQNNLLSGGDAYWRAVAQGAAGVVFILADFHGDVCQYMYPPHDASLRPIPSLFVGNRTGILLRCYAQANDTARLTLRGNYETRQVFNLWTRLPGALPDGPNLIFSTHADSPFKGVIEDGSGIVSVLAQAADWLQTPLAERPKDVYFVFTACHLYDGSPGGGFFVDNHPDIVANTKALLELEHLGARGTQVQLDDFTTLDELSPVGAFYAGGGYLQSELENMIATYPPAPGNINLIETGLPLTEAASWVGAKPDLPYVSFVTNPTYLLTVEDNWSKMDWAALHDANLRIRELSHRYMLNL